MCLDYLVNQLSKIQSLKNGLLTQYENIHIMVFRLCKKYFIPAFNK
jgi:hypothetical protein